MTEGDVRKIPSMRRVQHSVAGSGTDASGCQGWPPADSRQGYRDLDSATGGN